MTSDSLWQSKDKSMNSNQSEMTGLSGGEASLGTVGWRQPGYSKVWLVLTGIIKGETLGNKLVSVCFTDSSPF